MSYSDTEQFNCMFSNVKAAAFSLLFNQLGLRSSKLSDFPNDAILAIADLEEQVYRAIMKDQYFSDEEKQPEENIVELVHDGQNYGKKNQSHS